MKLSAGSGRKISDGNFTLGRLFNELNTSKATRTARKLSLQETIHSVTRHEAISGGEVKGTPEVRQSQMKTMRKNLQTELRNKTVVKNPSRSHSRSMTRADFKETTGGITGIAGATVYHSISRVSSARSSAFTESSVFQGNESVTTAEKSKSSSVDKKPDLTSSVYSRHMRTSLPQEQIPDLPVSPELVTHEKGIMSKDTLLRSDNDNSKAKEVKAERTDGGSEPAFLSHEIVSNYDLSEEKERTSLLSNTEDFNEDCSPKEREILVRMKDPQLKESLRNIIMRRRSSVLRLIPSRTFHRKASEAHDNELEKKQSLSSFDGNFDSESVFTVTDIGSQRPSSSVSMIARTTSDPSKEEASSSSIVLPPGSFCVEGTGSPTRSSAAVKPRTTNPLSRDNRRRLSSARSSVGGLSRPDSRASVYSKRKTDVITEETRVIRPSTARSRSSSLLRKRSTNSQPAESTVPYQDNHLTPEAKATMREKQMIREFLFMYAKVKQTPKTYQESERVRMMSETPEFVIKSAIGQFLTRAFPSGVSANSSSSFRSKEDRREDLQRMRLLRIKTCMEHLAAVAQ